MSEISSPARQLRVISTVALLGLLATIAWLIFRAGHTDFAARARKPVMELPIDKLLDISRYEGPLAKKYPGHLFRLDGQVVSVYDVEQMGRYGLRQSTGGALLIVPTPDTGAYLALFYKEETPKLQAIHPGAHVVFVCDRLETRTGQRMEGCTLDRTDPADKTAG